MGNSLLESKLRVYQFKTAKKDFFIDYIIRMRLQLAVESFLQLISATRIKLFLLLDFKRPFVDSKNVSLYT